MDIYKKAEELVRIVNEKKLIQERLRYLESCEESLEKELYYLFAAEKLDELYAGGYVLRPALKFTATAKGEKTVRVLRRRGFGKLVKPTVHPSTAHAFVREQTELNGGSTPAWILDNFNITEKETVSVRRH